MNEETDTRVEGGVICTRGAGENRHTTLPSDFEDVVKSEKLFMHDWNVFMRRFKPFADKELPHAYEAGFVSHTRNHSHHARARARET